MASVFILQHGFMVLTNFGMGHLGGFCFDPMCPCRRSGVKERSQYVEDD